MGRICVDERKRLKQIAENERLLREANDEIERDAREDPGLRREDVEIEFFCACGRPECDAKLLLTLAEYDAAHAEPDHFIVAPGHENPELERVVEEHATYLVVEKRPDLEVG
jgi:hypothetical protein